MTVRSRILRNCYVTASSGCHRYDYWNEQCLFDGRMDTGWCTPSRTLPQLEFLEVDLDGQHQLSRIRLLSRAINADAGFPVDFRFLVRTNGGQWQEVISEQGWTNAADTWHEWDFAPVGTDVVRLEVERVAFRSEGKYFLQFMNLEFYEPISSE